MRKENIWNANGRVGTENRGREKEGKGVAMGGCGGKRNTWLCDSLAPYCLLGKERRQKKRMRKRRGRKKSQRNAGTKEKERLKRVKL